MRRLFQRVLVALLMMAVPATAYSADDKPAASATPAEAIKMSPGFQVELLYSVPSDQQGSWVSLTTEKKGRLIASDQYGKLYRITPPAAGQAADQTKVEPIDLKIGMAQGLLYAFDSLYVVVNGEGPGLYRVRDTNGDDQYDDVQLLRKINGGGEHGPHAVVLSPDGKSLYIAAGNHTKLPDPEDSRVPRNWQEDQLLPRMWDAGGHAVGILAPGGWVCKTDPDGKTWEVIATGFRNEYDLAFNPAGELFTFDADMEWDVGTPWYRPTRVCHVTSGAEFGWRSGTGKWPSYYPDSLPAVVDIGPGSPTGIAFGTGAKFPAKFQKSLFIADWSYGIIYAVHLSPDGATYEGQAERFISAAPLPVTDLVVNPQDGALYFTIGGRRTQSGLYRVTYQGEESTAPVSDNAPTNELRKLRHQLETLHEPKGTEAIEQAWPYLSHDDRFIRYAARIAVEHQKVDLWKDRALQEQNPQAAILAMVALARQGDKSLQGQIISKLSQIDPQQLSENEQLAWLRAYQLAFARMGEPNATTHQLALKKLDPLYPADSGRLNRELSQLLVYLRAPQVADRTLALQAKAPTQEEELHYALTLRNLKDGWTIEGRKQYFDWFNRAAAHRGGHSFNGFLANIRKEAIETLTEQEKQALANVLAETPKPTQTVAEEPRPFVKEWRVQELLPAAETKLAGRNFERGRDLFAAAQCFKCHRFNGEGGITGPDLTGVSGRFNHQNLLESIIEPSKVVSDQYASTTFVLDDGKVVTGRVANLNGNNLMVIENMLDPGRMTGVNRDKIDEMRPSATSMMPTGLLNTLTEDEILDLLAYLRSGGNPDHEMFKK